MLAETRWGRGISLAALFAINAAGIAVTYMAFTNHHVPPALPDDPQVSVYGDTCLGKLGGPAVLQDWSKAQSGAQFLTVNVAAVDMTRCMQDEQKEAYVMKDGSSAITGVGVAGLLIFSDILFGSALFGRKRDDATTPKSPELTA